MENIIKNYRILNLQGSWFNFTGTTIGVKEFTLNTEGEITFKNKNDKEVKVKINENKLFSATMPYSLETYRAFKKFPDEMYIKDNEQYTRLFVNFKFTKNKIDDNKGDSKRKKINKKRLRKLIYTSTVKIDNVEYCFFKRGASKARTSNVIYCKKEYYDELFNPCLLGLKFEQGKEYDITSMQAYISLIMSGIIGTIKINKDEILIINDLQSPSFEAKQTVTEMKNGIISQNEDIFKVVNNMTDGQVLMDESIYKDNELLNTSTCALLRNDFFKGNACRTRLQAYYKENGITEVYDMFRGWIDASKIKLCITPSACKYLKFSDQFKDKKECFLNWLDNLDSTFGVVKIDHMGNYGYSNRLSYQMLNSMNLNKQDVLELMQDELNYFKLLNDNTLATNEDIRRMSKKNKEVNRNIRNEMSYFIDLVKNNKNNSLSTGDMVADLLNRNIDFRLTKKFKDWKDEQLQSYIDNLRLGKIRIKNSVYAIMISCPYEMLIATTMENNKIDNCIMDKWECFCPTFADNEQLISIRNPQINAGNIANLKNKWHDEYKYFGYYNEDNKPMFDFVVFINSYNTDIMNRLQGCDWDIDSCLLSNNVILQNKAMESQKWSTPVNGIKPNEEGNKKIYNNKALADLDDYLGGSSMAIGKIVNKSAIFNAYMYHALNNNYDEKYINACYRASSTLSSFSQISIDMAKKKFDGLSLTKRMNDLNKTYYINPEGKKEYILRYEKEFNKKTGKDEFKMIVPYFFKYTAKDNSYRIPTKMDCAMDYLEDILDNFVTKARQTDLIDIKDLLVMQKELDGSSYSGEQVDKVREIIDECQNILNANRYDINDSDEDKKENNNLRKWVKKEAIKKLKELNLNDKTVYRIVLRAFNVDARYKGNKLIRVDEEGNPITFKDYNIYDEELEEDFTEFNITIRELKEMTMLVLNLIYKSYPNSFIKCFKEKKAEAKATRFWV